MYHQLKKTGFWGSSWRKLAAHHWKYLGWTQASWIKHEEWVTAATA